MTTDVLPAASALGTARLLPAGSIADPALAAQLRSYRRRALTGVFTVSPGELPSFLPPGTLHASALPGGSPWFLLLEGGSASLLSASGQIIEGEAPLLAEARALAGRAAGRAVVAGELTATGQPIEALLAAGPRADLSKLSFVGLDLVAGGDGKARMPIGSFEDRAAVVRRLLDGGKLLHAARIDKVASPDAVASLYREIVDGHQARGLLLRSPQERLLKVVPPLTLFASVIGFTDRSNGELGSVLLSLRRPDGFFQIVDLCSHLGDADARRSLREALASRVAPSSYRHPGAHGELVRFVKPEVAVELRANDALSDDFSGGLLYSMALAFDGGAWSSVREAPTVHLIAPRVVRLLPPHESMRALMGLAQLADRCWLDGLDRPIARPATGPSQVIRREVWVKETKGKKSVRKLVAWKTNKADPFPPFVVHWTDYSPNRGEPLEREVHPAPSEDSVTAIASQLLAENVKKGWQRIA